MGVQVGKEEKTQLTSLENGLLHVTWVYFFCCCLRGDSFFAARQLDKQQFGLACVSEGKKMVPRACVRAELVSNLKGRASDRPGREKSW